MKAFITTGTKDFLEQHVQKHPELQVHFMKTATKTLVYYEHEQKNIFTSGQSFDLIASKGDLQREGFVVMEHIPVVLESRALFENGWKIDARSFPEDTGAAAIRILCPTKGNVYVVFIQWATKETYQAWKQTDNYVQIQEQIHKPAYFASRPFTHTYHMEEDDDVE